MKCKKYGDKNTALCILRKIYSFENDRSYETGEKMKKLGLIGLLICILFTTALAAAGFKLPPIPANLDAGIGIEDEAYNPQKGIGYLEVWAFWAKGSNGSAIIAQFVVSNTGFQNSFPGYNVTVIPPKGKAVNIFQEFDSETFSAKKSGLDVSFTNVKLKGNHPNYHVRLDDQKIKLDLLFKATGPGLKFGGDGNIRFGKDHDDFFRQVLLAPQARVSGNFSVNGKRFDISGNGYIDHLTQNVLTTSFSRHWYAIRFFNGDITVSHNGLVPSKGYSEPYIGQTAIIKNGKIKFLSHNASFSPAGHKVDPLSKYSVPERFVLRVNENGCKMKMDVRSGGFFERIEVLKRVNPITRKIIGTFLAKPYIYRYNAKTAALIDLGDGEKTYSGDVLASCIILK